MQQPGCLTRVVIELGVPAPEKIQKVPTKPSVEDQVREALDCIESGYESPVEWRMISRLYRDLKKSKKKNPRIENLIKMIEPVLSKYGYHGVDAGV